MQEHLGPDLLRILTVTHPVEAPFSGDVVTIGKGDE